MISGGVLSFMVPTRSFLDRFTPNFLDSLDIVTCTLVVFRVVWGRKMCGTVTFSKTTVDHIQNLENDIFHVS